MARANQRRQRPDFRARYQSILADKLEHKQQERTLGLVPWRSDDRILQISLRESERALNRAIIEWNDG